MVTFLKKQVGFNKSNVTLPLKDIFSKTHMGLYLRTKFQVSIENLTSFRYGDNSTPSP